MEKEIAMEKVQYRGHCQCCGRLQAVPRGLMSKHGYEIKGEQYGGYRYFSGVCQGERFVPMEVSIEESLRIVEAVKRQAVQLLAVAAEYREGKRFPKEVWGGAYKEGMIGRIAGQIMIPFAEAPSWKQEEAVRSAAWSAESQGKGAERFAQFLEELALACIGKELLKVEKVAPPAPIYCGEKKLIGRFGECEVYSVRGAKIFWKAIKPNVESGKRPAGQMSSREWRSLPAAA